MCTCTLYIYIQLCKVVSNVSIRIFICTCTYMYNKNTVSTCYKNNVGTGTLDSHFRWRRSQWSRYCPVELANGNLVQGQTEFSVGLVEINKYTCVIIIHVHVHVDT